MPFPVTLSFRALRHLAALVLATSPLTVRAAETPAIALPAALREPLLHATLLTNGRDQITLSVRNESAAAAQIVIPTGLICVARDGADLVIVRGAELTVAAGEVGEAQLPAAALDLAPIPPQPCSPREATEPRLAPLLKLLANFPDAPRPTVQLAVLAVVKDISFAQWRAIIAGRGEASAGSAGVASDDEVVQAVDALGLLRTAIPERTFALALDPDLRVRALRHPRCRAKAAQLYGLEIPGDPPDAASVPSLSQLLHSKEGDNCPVCRQRERMQAPSSDL